MAAATPESWASFFDGAPLLYVNGFSHPVGGPGVRHQHDSIEIVYHRRGGGRIEVAGQTIAFNEGDTVITPASVPHVQDNDGPGEDVCILLRPRRPMPAMPRLPMRVPGLPRRWLHQELSSLADDGCRIQPGASPSWSYRTTAVFAELLAIAASEGAERARSPQDRRMAAVREHIATHVHEPLSLAGIARQVGLSPDRLRHLFVQEHGVGIAAWTRELRVRRAKELLENAPITLAEIARQCGLGTDRYLAHVFRATTGMSPGAYRRSCRARLALTPPKRRHGPRLPLDSPRQPAY